MGRAKRVLQNLAGGACKKTATLRRVPTGGTGTLTTMARVDIPRVQQQTPYPIAPAYVEMSASNPAPSGSLPTLVPLPELDDGPHLSYAVQWLIFSACAVVGWVLVVRKSARARDQRAAKAQQVAADEVASTPV